MTDSIGKCAAINFECSKFLYDNSPAATATIIVQKLNLFSKAPSGFKIDRQKLWDG